MVWLHHTRLLSFFPKRRKRQHSLFRVLWLAPLLGSLSISPPTPLLFSVLLPRFTTPLITEKSGHKPLYSSLSFPHNTKTESQTQKLSHKNQIFAALPQRNSIVGQILVFYNHILGKSIKTILKNLIQDFDFFNIHFPNLSFQFRI